MGGKAFQPEGRASAKAQRLDRAWLDLETASIRGVQDVGMYVGVEDSKARPEDRGGSEIQTKKCEAGRSP